MKTLIFTLIVICMYEANAFTETCTRENTVCKPISDCQELNSLLKPTITTKEIQRIADARCERESSVLKVCCNEPVRANCRPSELPVNPDTGCCGKEFIQGSRLYGREVVYRYPWIARIEYENRHGETQLMCDGTLISSTYVLTAAACVVGEILTVATPINVRLGEYDTDSNPDCIPDEDGVEKYNDKVVIIPIKKVIAHADFSTVAGHNKLEDNDIALLKLKRLAPYTNFIRPICLPSLDHTILLSETESTRLHIAGWLTGNSVKKYGVVPFVGTEHCEAAYSEKNFKVWESQFCAGGKDSQMDCKIDAGGPLMFDNGQNIQIVGIYIFGPLPCGSNNKPIVCTDVRHYVTWITENVTP